MRFKYKVKFLNGTIVSKKYRTASDGCYFIIAAPLGSTSLHPQQCPVSKESKSTTAPNPPTST